MTTDPTPDIQPKPDFYALLATAFYDLADRIVELAGKGLPELSVSINLLTQLPDTAAGDEPKIAAIDEIGTALFGRPGQPQQMSDSTWHYGSQGGLGPIHAHIFDSITGPPEEKADRIARLRAQIAELEGDHPKPLSED